MMFIVKFLFVLLVIVFFVGRVIFLFIDINNCRLWERKFKKNCINGNGI